MRVIVCGSRVWDDRKAMERVLFDLWQRAEGDLTIIEGCARGADRMAESFIRWSGVGIEHYPANWKGRGRTAGLKRNRTMLDAKPELVVAFKDGFDESLRHGGTEHMVRIARDAGLETRVVSH